MLRTFLWLTAFTFLHIMVLVSGLNCHVFNSLKKDPDTTDAFTASTCPPVTELVLLIQNEINNGKIKDIRLSTSRELPFLPDSTTMSCGMVSIAANIPKGQHKKGHELFEMKVGGCYLIPKNDTTKTVFGLPEEPSINCLKAVSFPIKMGEKEIAAGLRFSCFCAQDDCNKKETIPNIKGLLRDKSGSAIPEAYGYGYSAGLSLYVFSIKYLLS